MVLSLVKLDLLSNNSKIPHKKYFEFRDVNHFLQYTISAVIFGLQNNQEQQLESKSTSF